MFNFAIVGIFYDGYVDLWKDFFGLIRHNWPNCPYKIFIVDNELNLDFKDTCGLDVTFINAGRDAEYSKKVQLAVQLIPCEYFLLLLEDFYFVNKIADNPLEKIMELIQNNDIDYYSMPMPEFIGRKEVNRYKNYNLFRISKNRQYIFSCQPSIWRKEFLNLCIGEYNFNAWIFEGIYAKTQCVRRDDFLESTVIDYGNPLGLRHGALQGKLVPETISLINKSGYMMTTSRLMLSRKENLIHNVKAFGSLLNLIPGMRYARKFFKVNSVLDRYDEDIMKMSVLTINEKKITNYLKIKYNK